MFVSENITQKRITRESSKNLHKKDFTLSPQSEQAVLVC